MKAISGVIAIVCIVTIISDEILLFIIQSTYRKSKALSATRKLINKLIRELEAVDKIAFSLLMLSSLIYCICLL